MIAPTDFEITDRVYNCLICGKHPEYKNISKSDIDYIGGSYCYYSFSCCGIEVISETSTADYIRKWNSYVTDLERTK